MLRSILGPPEIPGSRKQQRPSVRNLIPCSSGHVEMRHLNLIQCSLYSQFPPPLCYLKIPPGTLPQLYPLYDLSSSLARLGRNTVSSLRADRDFAAGVPPGAAEVSPIGSIFPCYISIFGASCIPHPSASWYKAHLPCHWRREGFHFFFIDPRSFSFRRSMGSMN